MITYILINIAVALIFGLDKYKAIHKLWRIPEKVLLALTLLAPWGALGGMRFFHHKTLHKQFDFAVLLGLLLHSYFWFKLPR